MRPPRSLAPLLVIFTLTGCGYVHFGRLPAERSDDAALRSAYADLAIERKILKEELALARREADALRAALDRAGGSAGAQAAPQIEEMTRELATVRAAYAQLQSGKRDAPEPSAAASETLTRLEEENASLQRDLQEARTENASLAEQLKTSVAAAETARGEATILSADLVAQKQARERAEQAMTALRAQLEAVMARAGRAPETAASLHGSASDSAPPASPTPTPDITADAAASVGLSALRQAKEPPSGAVPAVELRTSLSRARGAAATPSNGSTPSATPNPASGPTADTREAATAPVVAAPIAKADPPAAPRTYKVQAGDTLEKIAARMYGAADQWGRIYAANADLLGTNQGLKPGMELQIPAE